MTGSCPGNIGANPLSAHYYKLYYIIIFLKYNSNYLFKAIA